MADSTEPLLIRPTLKGVFLLLLFGTVVIVAAFYVYYRWAPVEWPQWLPLISFLALIPASLAYIDHFRERLVLSGNELRYDAGLFGSRARTLDLRMVSQAKAERSLIQRLWNVGSVVVETSAAGVGIEIRNVDAPGRVAKQIQAAVEAARMQMDGRKEL